MSRLSLEQLEDLVAHGRTPQVQRAAARAIQAVAARPRLVRTCAICRTPALEEDLIVEFGVFRHRVGCHQGGGG